LPEFKNPQQESGMERRLLLVFILTFVVIVLFQPILKKYLPQTSSTLSSESQKQPQPPAQPAAVVPSPQVAKQKPVPPDKAPTKQANTESQIIVENDLYRVTFTNRGAQVTSWILKKFDDEHGKPLDLVNNAASSKYGFPLSLWTYDENQRNTINSALYVSSESGTLTAPVTLGFEYADQDLSVRKVFRFDDTYVVQVETSVSMRGSQITAFPMWPAGLGDENSPAGYAAGHIEYQLNSSVERLAGKKISSGATQLGPFDWIAVTDQYFAAVFIPDNPGNASAVTLRNSLDIPKDAKNPQDTTKTDVLGVGAGDAHGNTTERLYAGPKQLQTLEAVRVPAITGKSPDLRALINFGFFEVIARPLFIWLRWTYNAKYIGIPNWGWAIIVQTIIINIALLPLRVSSMKSALKMQRVQPQMNAIKEKYKKYSMRDPRRQDMNTEIGELMKREGVSPVGGCLPMLIQMPFLFAYYSMLGSALDLRHAHWLWIHDLSSPDPYLILPIGIIITGLLTQRMTPQAGMDPSQQKMMNLMMPVMFGIISYRLAAGLCLYWVVGSLIAIAQQWVMNRTSLGQEMREMALKRARKREKK
jgi:YidC/Oxa1 family membrane protein insertase